MPAGAIVDPRAVMAWSEEIYRPALKLLVGGGGGGGDGGGNGIGIDGGSVEDFEFRARENDYVLGNLKVCLFENWFYFNRLKVPLFHVCVLACLLACVFVFVCMFVSHFLV
jgi:hypothetical protein